MTFSIIVPVYNVEQYIEECIRSILNQTYKEFELILVDDGSIDNSGKICDQYAQIDNRIKVIHKNNEGSTSARKIGCISSKNDYIVCVDSDDYLDIDFLNTINNNLDESIDVLCFGYKTDKNTIIANKLSSGVFSGLELFADFMYDLSKPFPNEGNILFGLCAKTFKRDLFVKYQTTIPNCVVMGEDLLLTAKILKTAKKVKIIDYHGYIYRENVSSITKAFNPYKIYQYIDTCYELIKVFKEQPNKVYCFASLCLFAIESDLVQSSSNFKTFKKYINQLDKFDGLKQYADKAIIKHCSIKSKIKIFLDRHNLYKLMYLLYK